MRRTGFFLIVLGLMLAALSSIGVYSVLQKKPAAPTPTPIPTIKVVVAAQNVADRTILQANMLTVRDWPQNLAPAGAASNPQDLVGKVTSGSLVIGEPVLMSKVSLEQEEIGLAPTLPPGLVAMVLSMAPVNAVAGAIRVGDAVDVLVSTEYSLYDEMGNESKPMQVTFYTIQDVPILAITGQVASAAGNPGGVGSAAGAAAGAAVPSAAYITILVTPQDALLLKYAREKGTIDLVLRSPQFHEQVVTDPVYLDYIVRRFDLPKPLIILKQSRTSTTGEPQ